MPIAVVVENNKKFELKSLPDGFVVIRRMNYGESLKRKDMMASVAMDMEKRSGQEQSTKLQMEILSEKTTLWEFSTLIMDHNLTDENDKPLSFKDPNHVKKLVGRVGDEIQQYINDLNSFEDDEEIKN